MHLNKSVVTKFTNLFQFQTKRSHQHSGSRTGPNKQPAKSFTKGHLCSRFKWKQHFRINLKSEHSGRDCRQQHQVPLPAIPLLNGTFRPTHAITLSLHSDKKKCLFQLRNG